MQPIENTENIEGLIKTFNVEARKGAQERILLKTLALAKSKVPNLHSGFGPWRTIMKSSITKLAAAAAVIIAIGLLAYHRPDWVDGTSVAWAEVFKNVEASDTVVCRAHVIDSNTSGSLQIESQGTLYFSSEFGTWLDFNDIKMNRTTTFTIAGNSRAHIEDGNRLDPRNVAEYFKGRKYTSLGLSTLNGIQVEGIQINNVDANLLGKSFAEGTAHLWVDIETNLPVKIELQGASADGNRRTHITLDDIRWNQEVPIFLKEYNSRLLMRKKQPPSEPNATSTIEGLKLFAAWSEGKYPSSLEWQTLKIEFKSAWRNYLAQLTAEQRNDEKKYAHEWSSNIATIFCFYSNLATMNKEPAYYGDKVAASDSNFVLMRWKIHDDEYRVVYGDLHTENVNAEKLADLEAAVK